MSIGESFRPIFQPSLFPDIEPNSYENIGARFSNDRKYRYALWRIWDSSLPLLMFVGLNPSTANEQKNDHTIRSVERICKSNYYGGFYMMNCFPLVSTNPDNLKINEQTKEIRRNDFYLIDISKKCKHIVFAWGNFDIVKNYKRDIELSKMFPNALALGINKNGSPKHPLYCKSTTKFIEWKK